MFLTREELEQLTERKRKADQVAWLRKHRIPYLIGANGHARVSRTFVEKLLGGSRHAPEPEPNFSALKAL
jgi:hypothetical protein